MERPGKGKEGREGRGGLIEIDLHHIPKCLSCLVYLSNCLLSAPLSCLFFCSFVRLRLVSSCRFVGDCESYCLFSLGGLGGKDGRKGREGGEGWEWEGREWEWEGKGRDTLDWHPLAHSMLLLFLLYFKYWWCEMLIMHWHLILTLYLSHSLTSLPHFLCLSVLPLSLWGFGAYVA